MSISHHVIQWAAVRTHWWLISDPPQKAKPFWCKLACHGHVPRYASKPPIIRVLVVRRPHSDNREEKISKKGQMQQVLSQDIPFTFYVYLEHSVFHGANFTFKICVVCWFLWVLFLFFLNTIYFLYSFTSGIVTYTNKWNKTGKNAWLLKHVLCWFFSLAAIIMEAEIMAALTELQLAKQFAHRSGDTGLWKGYLLVLKYVTLV